MGPNFYKMRTINCKNKKFRIGQSVIMTKVYVNGKTILTNGTIGKIVSESIINLPDMGLFNIRVLDIHFLNTDLSIGEDVAKEYMDTL